MTCFCITRPLLMVVVVVSFTTVPSGCVVVVVLVVDVVELVVTGDGGTATCGAGLADEQPAANTQRAIITKAKPASVRTEIMILACLRPRRRVKHPCRRGSPFHLSSSARPACARKRIELGEELATGQSLRARIQRP